jgi:hypothetical protein
MAMRGPLRRELGKYRRGQTGLMRGFPGTRHYVTGAMPGPVHGGHPADLYMWGVPQSYHPNLNAPAAQSDEYVTDPDWESHRVPLPHQDKVLRPFPQSEPTEPEFDYDEAKAHSELFLRAMEAQYQPLAEGEEAPTLADMWREHFSPEPELVPEMGDHIGGPAGMDVSPEQTQRNLPQFWEIADALGQLQKVLPEDHPDIVNLRAAAHEILQHPERLPQPEDFGVEWTESRLGPDNPYDVDLFGEPTQGADQMGYGANGFLEQPEAAFEQQMQTLDGLLEAAEPEPDIMPAMEMAGGLDAIVEPVDAYPGPGGLEQVIEEDLFGTGPIGFGHEQPEMTESLVSDPLAANAYGLAPEDEITQAMSHAARLAEQEPDPLAAAQQMFDEQMQYMDNPFLMPGMSPMMGPAPGM